MKFICYLGIIFMVMGCASRGYKVGDQIPEKHPYFSEGKPVIFAEGGNSEKIVYESFSSKKMRSLHKENKYLSAKELSKLQGSRGIASSEHDYVVIDDSNVEKIQPVSDNSEFLDKEGRRSRQVASRNKDKSEKKTEVFYSGPKKLHKTRGATRPYHHILYGQGKRVE